MNVFPSRTEIEDKKRNRRETEGERENPKFSVHLHSIASCPAEPDKQCALFLRQARGSRALLLTLFFTILILITRPSLRPLFFVSLAFPRIDFAQPAASRFPCFVSAAGVSEGPSCSVASNVFSGSCSILARLKDSELPACTSVIGRLAGGECDCSESCRS